MIKRKTVFFMLFLLLSFKQFFAQSLSVDSVGVKYKGRKELSKLEWKEKGFNLISDYKDHFNYYIKKVNRLGVKDNIAIIQCVYEYESNHWLVILDDEGMLLDYIETAYDNEEGFLGIKSFFYEEEIVVETYNVYEKPEEKKEGYYISKNRFLLKNDFVFEYLESYGSTCCPRDPARDNVKIGFEEFVKQFEKENSVVLKETYMVVNGKEGEKTYHVSFKGWEKKVKDKFIKQRVSSSRFLNWDTMKKRTYNDLVKRNRKGMIYKIN